MPAGVTTDGARADNRRPVPSRIVSLCPSITEALFAMGAGPRIVGVTDYCVHPREGVASLDKVGGSKLPDLDRIFALRPDLVVMNEEENRVEDFEEISARAIPVVRTFPRTVLDTASMLRDVGKAVGCEAAAEKIARDVERAVEAALASSRGKPPLRAACLVWMRPFMAVNRDTFVHDMMRIAGFENVFADRPERYPRLEARELEGLRARQGLEAILLPNEPFEFVAQHATEIAALVRLPTARAVLCDGQALSWYGSRTPWGIERTVKLAERIRALPSID